MATRWIICVLLVLAASRQTGATWTTFLYPFQWIRELFSSSTTSTEFSRRMGELLENNATSFLDDIRKDMRFWPNVTVALRPDRDLNGTADGSPLYQESNGTVLLQNSNGTLLFQEANGTLLFQGANGTGPRHGSTRTWATGLPSSDPQRTLAEEDEDKWKEYFEQLLTHDTAFCFSLLVCEISARPDNFLEYGRRVAKFFETYRPSSSNSAAWWYKNAAELGRKGRSLAECRANYPFCFVDTRQLVALLEVPPNGNT